MLIESVMPVGIARPQAIERGSFVAENQAATFELPLPLGSKTAGNNEQGKPKSIDDAVRDLNEAVKPFAISLEFSSDEETGSTVVKVLDQRTGEILRQIPDDTRLHLAAALGKLQGRLFDRKA